MAEQDLLPVFGPGPVWGEPPIHVHIHPHKHIAIGHPNVSHGERPAMLPWNRLGRPKHTLPPKTRNRPSGVRR